MHAARTISYADSNSRRRLPGIELDNQELFRGVEPEALEPFLRDCRIETLPAGDVLIEAGHANTQLYLLLDGSLGVHLGSPEEPPLVHAKPGETIGELSLIDGRAGLAHVVAATECRVMVLDEELVWLLVNTFHAVSTNLLFTLARRLRHGNELISEDRQQIREYQFQATVDGLTELFNRYWLDKMLPRQMERSRRSGLPLCVLMLDIDHFKRVNDEFGHPAGDEVIREVARRLRDNIRALDLPARYGGEEFALICPSTSLDAALGLAERLRLVVAETPVETGGEQIHISLSAGVAQMEGTDGAEALISAADNALYRAKHAGRNCVSL